MDVPYPFTLQVVKSRHVSSIRSSTYPGKLRRALAMMVLDATVDLDTLIGNVGAVEKARHPALI